MHKYKSSKQWQKSSKQKALMLTRKFSKQIMESSKQIISILDIMALKKDRSVFCV